MRGNSSSPTHENWLLAGFYGANNTGDDAMLEGLLGQLPRATCESLIVVTRGEDAPPSTVKFGAAATRATPLNVLRHLLHTRGIIQAGGTNFHDDLSGAAYIRFAVRLAQIAMLFVLARALGKKVVLLAVGVGPLSRLPTRIAARLATAAATIITVRDEASEEEIRRWVSPDKLTRTFDLAVLLDPVTRTTREPSSDGGTCDMLLGVSLAPLSSSKTSTDPDGSGYWSKFASCLLAQLADRPRLRVRIFVFAATERRGDRQISDDLYERLAARFAERVELFPYDPEPSATLAAVAECDAFVATRYHAAMFAYVCHVPTVMVAYHRKVQDLARAIQAPDRALLDPYELMSDRSVRDRIASLLDSRAQFLPAMPPDAARKEALRNFEVLERVGVLG